MEAWLPTFLKSHRIDCEPVAAEKYGRSIAVCFLMRCIILKAKVSKVSTGIVLSSTPMCSLPNFGTKLW